LATLFKNLITFYGMPYSEWMAMPWLTMVMFLNEMGRQHEAEKEAAEREKWKLEVQGWRNRMKGL